MNLQEIKDEAFYSKKPHNSKDFQTNYEYLFFIVYDLMFKCHRNQLLDIDDGKKLNAEIEKLWNVMVLNENIKKEKAQAIVSTAKEIKAKIDAEKEIDFEEYTHKHNFSEGHWLIIGEILNEVLQVDVELKEGLGQ